MKEQITFGDVSQEYSEFVEKFKPKKTTDDCYTPANIYGVIRDWVCKEYGVDASQIIRPFKPNGDYLREDYDGRVVVDNPPFSILTEIVKNYIDGGGEVLPVCARAHVFWSWSIRLYNSNGLGNHIPERGGSANEFYNKLRRKVRGQNVPRVVQTHKGRRRKEQSATRQIASEIQLPVERNDGGGRAEVRGVWNRPSREKRRGVFH